MHLSERIHPVWFGLICSLLAATVSAAEPCRIAFDIGSSGIRAGASNSRVTTQIDIDYLDPLWAGRGLDETVSGTITALRELPEQGGFSAECARVGGGFSAWRLALRQDIERLVSALARIKAASGVAVLVMPQNAEGAYGYYAARQLLGDRLTTSHVLDIGGGSLQIAGARTSFGAALGQKIWHRHLCQALRKTTSKACPLQPMSRDELSMAYALLAEKLQGVRVALPESVTMTAISRPVTQGVMPAVKRLLGQSDEYHILRRSDLSAAIEKVVSLTLEETTAQLEISEKYAAYLLSDMLLVDGLMQATGSDDLLIAELDLTNLPGLLADDRAFDWSEHYGCYLERLRYLGLGAYSSDPASCGNAP